MSKKIIVACLVLVAVIALSVAGLNLMKGKFQPKTEGAAQSKSEKQAVTHSKAQPVMPKEKSKAEVEFEKAQGLYNQGKVDEAVAGYEDVIKIDPKFASAYTEIGIIFMEKEQWDDAIKELQKSFEIEPNTPKAHYALAVSFARKPDPDAKLARFHFDKSRELGFVSPPWFEDYLKRLEAGKTQ